MALTEQEASIVALFLESAAWGVFLVTFGLCLRSLLLTKSGLKSWSEINRPMLLVCLAMPIFATVQVALNTIRALESLGPTGISEQFTNLGSAAEVLKFICVNMQTLIGDGILVRVGLRCAAEGLTLYCRRIVAGLFMGNPGLWLRSQHSFG